MLFIKAT